MQHNHGKARCFIMLVFAVVMAHAISGHAATKLFGIVYEETANREELAAIDPSTAAATVIGTGISDCCMVSGASGRWGADFGPCCLSQRQRS